MQGAALLRDICRCDFIKKRRSRELGADGAPPVTERGLQGGLLKIGPSRGAQSSYRSLSENNQLERKIEITETNQQHFYNNISNYY